MNRRKLCSRLAKLASKLDNEGSYDDAEVVDRALRVLVASELSLHKHKAEMQLTRDWITYNQTAAKVKLIETKVANLRDNNEGTSDIEFSG